MTINTRAVRGDSLAHRFTWAEVALLAVVVLGLLHHVDHVLRVDHSGWPFKDELTPFTFSLLVYPIAVIVLLLRNRPWLRVGLVAVVFVAVQAAHVLVEQPADQYGVWATGVSAEEESLGDPNLLEIRSPVLGAAAVGISILLSIVLIATLILLIREARHPGRLQPSVRGHG